VKVTVTDWLLDPAIATTCPEGATVATALSCVVAAYGIFSEPLSRRQRREIEGQSQGCGRIPVVGRELHGDWPIPRAHHRIDLAAR
jgi:hypothetical protein